MKALYEVAAPAKLNLFLHITGRRPDGLHTLQTVFQLLDWGDEVGLRVRDDGEICRVDPLPGVPDQLSFTSAESCVAGSAARSSVVCSSGAKT